MAQLTPGEPEDQLRGPFENFMVEIATIIGWNVVCTGETALPGRLGIPDYAVHRNKLLAGYVELKAPGIGVTPSGFKNRNREQFKRFSTIPNILYTDGNDWALYRAGERIGDVVHLSGDIVADAKKAATVSDAFAIEKLLRDFLQWQPIIPTDHKGKIDLQGLAALLAPLCRMLREDVVDALKDPESPIVQLAQDWRSLLFPDAPDEQFADAYAQTITFALLLGRSEGAQPLTLKSAEASLAAEHNLLSRALQVLTDPDARREMTASLDLLLRVIGEVPTATLAGPEDPWLYFYEDFLAAYDPELRRDAGAYYTPVQVVKCQVRLIDSLLVHRFGKPFGFVNHDVVTLDPAVGTGTYLLGIIDHALQRIESEQGPGAVEGQATALASNLFGFELMVGPYAVADLRISRTLRKRGAKLARDGTHVYLTDTLESPNAKPPQLPLILRPIADQHEKALKVKAHVPVIVCIGNPPYDRHEAANANNKARTGGWVRWGDHGSNKKPILSDFIEPAISEGYGKHLKNLYNLYIYFWRWALWKVFEHEGDARPGIVSFITASSYLDGDAFCGVRQHIRREADEVWILDLGGEGRGTRQSENVFAIQTPVAIAVAIRSEKPNKAKPAHIHYARIEGNRDQKLVTLDKIFAVSDVNWQDCPNDWQAPFRPAGTGKYFDWPLLIDLMPWQHSGSQFKRTWPICPDSETLKKRWKALLKSPDRRDAFRETRDRKINSVCPPLPGTDGSPKPIDQLPPSSATPRIERYAFRSFDRQWILADSRVGDFLRPDLWRAHGKSQVYLTSLLTTFLGSGPALTACAEIPDLHYFSGRGQKDVIPLYRRSDASEANILPDLLELLSKEYQRQVSPDDFIAYVYCVLGHPSFTSRFSNELESRELRVPITKNGVVFEQARAIGANLLWLHTFGERFMPKGKASGFLPTGTVKCINPIPNGKSKDDYPDSFEYEPVTSTLRVGAGTFAPVPLDVYEFEVSGLKVVQSWLRYRMRDGAGRNTSSLNEIRPRYWPAQFTTELLQLLWVLEKTIQVYPEQEKLLEKIISGDLFNAQELPSVPKARRTAPKEEGVGLPQLDFGDQG